MYRPRWPRGRAFRLGYGRLQVRSPAATYQKSFKDGTSSSLAYARHWKVSAWKYGWSARCQLIVWLGGVLLSSACDRSVPVWQHSNLSHAGTSQYDWNIVQETLNPSTNNKQTNRTNNIFSGHTPIFTLICAFCSLSNAFYKLVVEFLHIALDRWND